MKHGTWCKAEGSRVLDKEGNLMWKSLIPVITNVLTNVLYLLVMAVGWKLAKASDMN